MKHVWLLTMGLLVAVGCSPDPLTLDQRVEMMVYQSEKLQNEIYELNRRIAELSPEGSGTAVPQHSPTRLAAESDDPFRATSIGLHRATGGTDSDGKVGDEGLRVVVQPKDASGDVVKRAGAFEIELFDLAIDKGDRRLGKWQYTVDQAAKEWVSGIFGVSGYSFQIPWPEGRVPQHDHLTVAVRMTTLDGRPLTAQKDVVITLPGEADEGLKAGAEGKSE
jgi:hypothetical protein